MAISRIIQGMKNVIGYHTEFKPFLKPIICIIGITERCNLKCKMCDIWKEPKKDILELDDFKRIFSSQILKNIGALLLSGGETFIRKDVVEICSLAKRHLPHLEEVRFVTNGTLTKKIISDVRQILNEVGLKVYLKISIDGLEKTHDEIRGMPGTFAKAMETLEGLKDLRGKWDRELTLAVGFTAMNENIDEIWNLYEKFNDVEFFFKPALDYILIGEGDKLKGSHLGVSEETLQTLIKFTEEYIVKEFNGKKGLMKTIAKYFYLYQLEFMKNPNSLPLPCAAGFSTLSITYDGGGYPCTMSGAEAVGNVKYNSLDEIWYSDKMNKMRRQIKTGKCRCWTACNMYPSLVTSKWFQIGTDYLIGKLKKIGM